MPLSRAAFDAHARRMRTLDRGARNGVARLVEREGDPRSLLMHVETLTGELSTVSTAVSAEFYDLVRLQSGARGYYDARTVGTSTSRIGAAFEYAMDTDAAALLGIMQAVVASEVMGAGRRTVMDNAEADRWCDGYDSVPTSPNPCAFCIVRSLASSRNYAGERLLHEVDGDTWHDNCSCQLVPAFGDAPKWRRDQVREFQGAYDAASDAISGDVDPDLAARIEAAKAAHDGKWGQLNEVTIAMRFLQPSLSH